MDFCEKQLVEVDPFVLKTGKSGCFERLERKSKPVFELLQQTNNDWEAVYFACWQERIKHERETFLK
jgi:hypothetical protein